MYTSTPLSLLPFSLQHFLLLPSFLQASPPVFAPLFPLIILQMFHPLSFYHPHLSLSPHASVTFISIFCLFPPFSILIRCFSFFLSSLLFPSSFSPRFLSPFPSYHPPMFHPLSFYHPHLSLSPHASVTFISIFCLFPPFSIASLSFAPPSPLVLIILPLLYFYSPLLPWKFFSSVRLLSFTLFCPLF